ncbi:nucleotidyltransferase family protein [Amycolatopsis methanolica]|uniref:Nucleotidyl transferase family enzyme n=1 Tax=Amycolatopsis methanolica 239 TaxID=1068978 RepID=A0A076MS64_AMYME|nr:nucleotidyltransferase family protein [Amycolatopsis methanolica]AIJ20622.1 nucleotidyl transferase family enzyme [Amycolatopsis methanolica 239]
MKAFLLAAGLGTRLRPLTDHTPKCLVEIGGRPMLDIWLDALEAAGVDEVLVNLHHLAPLVWAHLAERRGGPLVRTAEEPELLGSAGTVSANRDFVAGEEMFLALNADNLTDFDLRVLIEAHRAGGAIATLSVFRAPDPTQCGILTVADGLVTGFTEKPAKPTGSLANAGMYAFSPAVLDLIGPPPRDIGYHLLPELVGRARAVSLGDSWFLDIGTPAALARAREVWQGRRAS